MWWSRSGWPISNDHHQGDHDQGDISAMRWSSSGTPIFNVIIRIRVTIMRVTYLQWEHRCTKHLCCSMDLASQGQSSKRTQYDDVNVDNNFDANLDADFDANFDATLICTFQICYIPARGTFQMYSSSNFFPSRICTFVCFAFHFINHLFQEKQDIHGRL